MGPRIAERLPAATLSIAALGMAPSCYGLPAAKVSEAMMELVEMVRDGNARAARLALDHVLTRAGLWLRADEPVFTVSRSATDARGARALVRVLGELVGASAAPAG
jgi:hypothetical protein